MQKKEYDWVKKLILPVSLFVCFLILGSFFPSKAQESERSVTMMSFEGEDVRIWGDDDQTCTAIRGKHTECQAIADKCVEEGGCTPQLATLSFMGCDKCDAVAQPCFDSVEADYKQCIKTAAAKYKEEQSSEVPTPSAPTAVPVAPSAAPYSGPLIKVPFTIPGWLNLLDWTKKAKFTLFLIEKGDLFTLWGGGLDHSLCDPEDCERTTPEGSENYRRELYERRLREFNELIERMRNKEPWPFLKDVEIGDDGKPIFIKTPEGAFEIQPFNNQKAKLEYKGNIPVLKSGQLEVFEENKGPTPNTIETPNAELFIIGTHFLLTYDQKEKYTGLAVFDGQVEIKPKGSSTSKIVSPNGDTPGEMFVTSKTSIVKLAIFWLVLAAVIGGIVMLIKRKR